MISGAGSLSRLGDAAGELGLRRTLLVVDPGLHATGIPHRARTLLGEAGLTVDTFDQFGPNPDSDTVEKGRAFAAPLGIDSIIALGGGSALDTAKGINFLLTNGGRMEDYRGYGKARVPLLPSIGIPTTAGTGSEAQTYCVISDSATHMKMACGDPSAAFRVVILDPDLTQTVPKAVRAAAGIDAAAHVIETWVSTKANDASRDLTILAWQMIKGALLPSIESAEDADVRGAMMMGAFYAGAAIEASMLGAAHACSNPLTARYGTTHGVALGILVPHVVRWNAEIDDSQYERLGGSAALAAWIEAAARSAGFPSTLRAIGANAEDIPQLAEMAATQWTGTFNPRPLGVEGARRVYETAY
ncbi:MAG: iron-containing alcohol dehydrogenase [Acidobacteriota bacterium]|nr:iron-containing alcohol dehydrogenase [Acidobacteriota bacterium]